ncbi:hypothetical protein ACQ4M3_02230 [Leptolyngbya sp. AN03gr2]|uniref:hypothetical protein n=1 Tax=unclassified Leptolyngbya TaxID=2650499 RepID=UPI003D31041F
MEFYLIESALIELGGESFYGTASEFEGVLRDNDLSSVKKAEAIAGILRDRLKTQKMTPQGVKR